MTQRDAVRTFEFVGTVVFCFAVGWLIAHALAVRDAILTALGQ
jgi:hypothetical protein